MYSLRFDFETGDWDFSDRRGVTVSGVERLRQMLNMWLSEARGVDRFHTGYGSRLGRMIGSPGDDNMRRNIEQEIRTVVNAYIEMINQDFQRNPSAYTRDEVPLQIILIDSRWSSGRLEYGAIGDVLTCDIYIRTMAGTTDTVSLQV